MPQDYYCHSSSYIDQPVHIGTGTSVLHFCHIMSNSIIGENCKIGRNVTIESGVIIGNNVIIDTNSLLKTGVIIEDNVICGPSTMFAPSPTVKNRQLKPKASDITPTIIKHDVSIGANSTIICGVNIGAYALIGAGSVITEDVSDYAMVFGNPEIGRASCRERVYTKV